MADMSVWWETCPMDEPTDEFVRRLKQRIEADKSLTPAGLAKRAGLDNSAIRSLLAGRAKSPKFSTVMRVVEALDTTLEEFMGDAKTEAEQDILRLIGRMHERERLQLLGFAKALASEQSMAPPAGDEEIQ